MIVKTIYYILSDNRHRGVSCVANHGQSQARPGHLVLQGPAQNSWESGAILILVGTCGLLE